jgi:UDP-GlcNAc:undecaprenyl-phosphate/decaprenyl-phosphate GlcNAc-1-phosphate transferase
MGDRALFEPFAHSGGWPLLALCVSVASAAVTWAHIAVARRVRLLAPADGWHDKPVAQAGGIAVWVTILGACAALGLLRDPLLLRILGAGVALAIVGFIDDRRPFQPTTKLVLQLAVSTALVATTFYKPGEIPRVIALPIAVVWLVGQSNAVNLIDNMDGACPMVVGVSALGAAAMQAAAGSPALVALCLVIAGASFGFLAWNRRPARVFLGDTGSLSLGFVLAAVAMHSAWLGPGAAWTRVLLPPLVLIVPLLNVIFVIVTRRDAGIPVSRGLSDHINYRMVGHGLTVDRAMIALGLLAAMGGLLARMWWTWSLHLWVALTALFALGVAYVAVFLSHADVEKVYARLNVVRRPPISTEYRVKRRRLFEVLSDAVIAVVAYFLAFQLRFDGELPPVQEANLGQGLPVVLLIGVTALWANGMYRVFWKYMGMDEMLRIARAAVVTGAALFFVTFLPRFSSFPRSMYFLFPMLFAVLATAYRISLRVMHGIWQAPRAGAAASKILIVGAGDAGELALRTIRNGAMIGVAPCGFLDDDPEKIGMRIHGIPVLAPTSALVPLANELGITEVLVAMPTASAGRVAGIVRACEEGGLKPRFFMQHSGISQPLATT